MQSATDEGPSCEWLHEWYKRKKVGVGTDHKDSESWQHVPGATLAIAMAIEVQWRVCRDSEEWQNEEMVVNGKEALSYWLGRCRI